MLDVLDQFSYTAMHHSSTAPGWYPTFIVIAIISSSCHGYKTSPMVHCWLELTDSLVSKGGEAAADLCSCLNGHDHRAVGEIEIKRGVLKLGSNQVVTENQTPGYGKLHHWAMIPTYTRHFHCPPTETTTCVQLSSHLQCISAKDRVCLTFHRHSNNVCGNSNNLKLPNNTMKKWLEGFPLRSASGNRTRNEKESCQHLYYIQLHSQAIASQQASLILDIKSINPPAHLIHNTYQSDFLSWAHWAALE